MTDVVIEDVPDPALAVIDERAEWLGLSRSEYLRRALLRDAAPLSHEITREDLIRFSERFADLADPAVMREAWG